MRDKKKVLKFVVDEKETSEIMKWKIGLRN